MNPGLPHVRLTFAALAFFALFTQCKKQGSEDYILTGKIRNARTGNGIGNATVTVEQQALEDGTFGVFNEAGSDVTQGDGTFSINWPRSNAAAIRMTAEKPGFITRQMELNPDEFSAGRELYKTLSLYPEAFIAVSLFNQAPSGSGDLVNFKFDGAPFDCNCCSLDWRNFYGGDIDTTFSCRIYGDIWLRYRAEIFSDEGTQLIIDSIWCPSFETTSLNLVY